jgi:hypothetical protein
MLRRALALNQSLHRELHLAVASEERDRFFTYSAPCKLSQHKCHNWNNFFLVGV